MSNRSWIWNAPKPLLLAGPTAVGKSAVALELAELLEGEIISVDSMQVYRGLPIGTAKPSEAERRRAPHHLIDFVDPLEPFTAGRFVTEAARIGQEIQARQKVPILCGGSGLYFQAVIEGLNDGPPSDPAIRQELEGLSTERLLTELSQGDPARFEAIDRSNRRRVLRAVEKLRSACPATTMTAPARWERRGGAEQGLVGRDSVEPSNKVDPPSRYGPTDARLFFVALRRSKEDLHRRIEKRVADMFKAGWINETKELIAKARQSLAAPSAAAWQAIGYKEILEYLEGRVSMPELTARIQARTRQFAKRQITWFKRQTDIQWIDLAPEESALVTAQRIAAMYLTQRPSETLNL